MIFIKVLELFIRVIIGQRGRILLGKILGDFRRLPHLVHVPMKLVPAVQDFRSEELFVRDGVNQLLLTDTAFFKLFIMASVSSRPFTYALAASRNGAPRFLFNSI